MEKNKRKLSSQKNDFISILLLLKYIKIVESEIKYLYELFKNKLILISFTILDKSLAEYYIK